MVKKRGMFLGLALFVWFEVASQVCDGVRQEITPLF